MNFEIKTGKEYLKDKSVSLAARGLMSTMLDLQETLRAENKEVKFSIAELAPLVSDSKYQIRKLLNELEDKEYLVRKRVCSNGKVQKWEYFCTGDKLPKEITDLSFKSPTGKIKNAFKKKLNTDKRNPRLENKDVDFLVNKGKRNEPENRKENKSESTANAEFNTSNETPRLKNQDVEFPHNMIDRYDIKNNNTCFNNHIYQSLVNLQVNVNEQDENQNVENYREIIKGNISYDYLCDCEDVEEVNCIVDVMTDVVCSEAKEMRVAKRNIPVSVLKSLFLKLNENHVQYVLNNLRKTVTDIRNIKAYLITSLYNAMQTLQLHTNADVRNCLYGNKAISSGKATDEEVSYDINEFNKFAITFSENTRKKASYDLSKVVPAWMC